MAVELAERFHFPDSREMNPWYILKTMTDKERYLCIRLVASGVLGRSQQSLKQGHLDVDAAEWLVQDGILRKLVLREVAQEVTKNPDFVEKKKGLEIEGGFLAANNQDKHFISLFDTAEDLVNGEGTYLNPEEIRYIISDTGLHALIEFMG